MRDWASYELQDGGNGGGNTLVLKGPMLVSTIGVLDPQLRQLDADVSRIDLSSVREIDTVGAWLVLRFCRRNDCAVEGASDEAKVLLEAIGETATDVDVKPPRDNLLVRVPEGVGETVMGFAKGAKQMVSFLGALLFAIGRMIRRPKRFPGKALVRQLELVGVSSLGIIGLMSFLIGIVVAQQGAAQLRQFGAEIYTINLTGRLVLRELGVLMTAIMVAGRSGSAFAAQIGTMQLTEEVDAMRTIGVSPTEKLIFPRVMAAVIMMPLLGFFSSVVAIVGGAFVADLTLGIPFLNFLQRIQEVVPPYDLWVGLIKAPVFGLIVAMTGCYQGMQVKGNAEDVGLRTTKAVVFGIFMVIVLDAFFAVFFTEIGWA
ncbi:ABC transporter permease [Paraurantiacibacter namhicola]|uniref:Putative phospholipid ABC transporter permease protein MlaE n=1 Tax=Paraurantiacibacter namhicola TaxID=645517 RepID=A0A1C7DB77_9SPHN|nr:MlaE family lipid ABC transporter permease subunit [Paraurantiacibacter namhicola]ANU08632.1 putative phospholipid ABC transporter permease protein MlaE [Paraurantiacibacter namhicola]